MNFLIYLVVLIIIPLGVMKFIFNRTHLLVSLLSLELISVSIYFVLSNIVLCGGVDASYILYFLTMVVCEGVLGLALLILLSYSHGADNMKSFISLLC